MKFKKKWNSCCGCFLSNNPWTCSLYLHTHTRRCYECLQLFSRLLVWTILCFPVLELSRTYDVLLLLWIFAYFPISIVYPKSRYLLRFARWKISDIPDVLCVHIFSSHSVFLTISSHSFLCHIFLLMINLTKRSSHSKQTNLLGGIDASKSCPCIGV